MFLGIHGVMQLRAVLFFDLFVQAFIERERSYRHLLGFQLRVQFLDGRDDLFNLRVPKFQSVNHRFFGNFQRPGLHHHNGVFRAGNHNVHQTFLLVGHRGIGNQLPIQKSHAHRGNRLLKRKIGAIAGG